MKSSKSKELVRFFLIAFFWMWLINLPRVMAAFGWFEIPALLSTIMGYVAIFSPAVAAFILTRIHSGKEGVKALWRSGWRTPFKKKWLIPAILLIPLSGLLTWGIMALLDQPIEWEYGAPIAMIVPIGLLIWLLNAYPEEYGWRGYALPRLLDKFSPLIASIFLGIIWGLWHLPLHFIPGTTQYVIPFWQFFLQTILLSILYTWLHIGTGGSVFIAALFHAFGNITGAALPYWTNNLGRWISFGIQLVIALVIVLFSRQFKSEKQDARVRKSKL